MPENADEAKKQVLTVTFGIPKEVMPKLGYDETAFARYARRLVAMDLYKNKGVSLGYCAEAAEMGAEAFICFLGEHKVSVFGFETADEFLEETVNA
jgi:predicted HTH domain antitoxin